MNLFKGITKYYLFTLGATACMFISCAREENPVIGESGLPIIIDATISQEVSTRNYQEKGVVEYGTFYLTYSNPIGNPQYNVATVNFYEGTGFVTTESGDELTWNHVGFDPSGNSASSTFYLDNVAYMSPDNSVESIPLPTDNPYKAAKFDYTDGSNDLLWGNQSVDRGADKVSIKLHHSMSMVRVIVSVDASAEGSIPPDLQNATIEITNIITTPVSYDRLTGKLNFGENPSYSNIYISAPGINNWSQIVSDEFNERITHYKASDFVVPPQDLATGDLRARLRILIPQEDGSSQIYSGPLPRAMTVEGKDGSVVSENFSFKREHILTLRVTLDPDLLELQFMPVTVVDWVNKGSYTLTGSQAAIFEDSDFIKMIQAYNSGNWSELERYGYKSDEIWIFNIYSDLTLSMDDIMGKMPQMKDYPYKFKFNGQTVTIIKSDGESIILNKENKNEDLLYEILQGEN